MISTPLRPAVDRRRFLAACTAAGLGPTLFPGALLALAANPAEAQSPTPDAPIKITPAMIDAAAVIAGITLADDVKAAMLEGLTGQRDSVLDIRKLSLPNSVAPALVFNPVPPAWSSTPPKSRSSSARPPKWTSPPAHPPK